MAKRKAAEVKRVDVPTFIFRLDGEHITVACDWPTNRMDDDGVDKLGFLFYALNTGRLHETIADAIMNRAQGENEAYVGMAIFRAANEYFERAKKDVEEDDGRGDGPLVPPSRAFNPPLSEEDKSD